MVENRREGGSKGGALWKGLVAFLVVSNVITLVGVLVMVRPSSDSGASPLSSRDESHSIIKRAVKTQHVDAVPTCPRNNAVKAANNATKDVLDPLTPRELLRVRDFLLSNPKMKLTPYANATAASNYIYIIQLHVPSKDEVLATLDVETDRYASVVIFRGADKPRRVQTLKVGPLSAKKLRYEEPSDPDSEKKFLRRSWTYIEYVGMKAALERALDARILAVFNQSFDSQPTWTNCKPKCFSWVISPIFGEDHGKRIMWLSTSRQQEAEYLFPMDLYGEMDLTDPSNIVLRRIFYGGKMYSGPAELLRTVQRDPTARAKPFPWMKDEEQMFSSMRRRVDHPSARSRNAQREPKQFSPDGDRFSVTGNRVSYMDWRFRFLMTSTIGMKLFDIRFRNERIAYEISLQEMAATYSGFNPAMAEATFIDGGYLPGTASMELFPGVDCPDNAVMLDAHHMADNGELLHIRNAICIFEHNLGIPLRRHFAADYFDGGPYGFYAGQTDVALVIRTISLAYNYNYVIDYIFHINGALESRIASTGYIWSAVNRPEERRYGTVLRDHLNGPLHNHWFHFKLDLDVLGRNNTFETIDFKLEKGAAGAEKRHHWRNATRPQVVFERNPRRTEKSALLDSSLDAPKYWVVSNPASKNRNGVPRSYRLQTTSFAKWLQPETIEINDAFSWVRHQLAVTKYKPGEDESSNMYLGHGQRDPVIKFSDMYADDDNIENKDVVLWLTLGLYHLPHTEDIPLTYTTGAKVSFLLQPYNYFDEDPSMVENNLVFAQKNRATGKVAVTRYTNTHTCTPTFDHEPYDGDIDYRPAAGKGNKEP